MGHKSVGLTREHQRSAFREARKAVENDPDAPDEPTDGEVVREVCEAYTGFRFGQVDA